MSNPVAGRTRKKCRKCLRILPLERFYRLCSSPDGRKYECRECCAVYQQTGAYKSSIAKYWSSPLGKRKRRQYKTRHPEAVKARAKINNAIRDGRLERPESCQRCGSNGRIEAHHADYSKPLEVEWLCPLCHKQEHRKCS